MEINSFSENTKSGSPLLHFIMSQRTAAKGAAKGVATLVTINRHNVPGNSDSDATVAAYIVHCSDVLDNVHNDFLEETLAVEQRSVLPCAVQCVVVDGLGDDILLVPLHQHVVTLLLAALDLRGCRPVSVCSR